MNKVELSKTFRFESAHLLPKMPEGHKCRRLHGHSYQVEVVVVGYPDRDTGIFIDYADIAQAWEPIHEALDHRYLNEVEGLSNPTSEVLAHWIWVRLKPKLPFMQALTIRETCTSRCTYRGR